MYPRRFISVVHARTIWEMSQPVVVGLPETRREAFYTNLGPGHYRFTVIACDERRLEHCAR